MRRFCSLWIRLIFHTQFVANKLSVKYQSYTKSTKIDAFEQKKIRTSRNPINKE